MEKVTVSERVRRGFTLIELLVVIAVIGILASILFPSLAKAREAAQGTACASNQRQINFALKFYTNDFNGAWPTTIGLSKLPSLRLPAADQKTKKDFVAQLRPYLHNQDVWFCPLVPADNVLAHFATVDGVTTANTAPLDPVTNQPIVDYRDPTNAAANPKLWSYRAVGGTYLVNQFTVHLPSMMGYPGQVYQGKSVDQVDDATKAITLWDDPCCAGSILEAWLRIPHNNGINVSYLDGHTGWTQVLPIQDPNNPTVTTDNLWCCTGVLEDGWLATRANYTSSDANAGH